MEPEPLPDVVALSAKWGAPVHGAVNVKTSEALDEGYHACLDDFFVRFSNQRRDTDQIQTVGTALRVYAGIPHAELGSDTVTYDGTCPTLKTPDGRPLQPFTLPIIP